MLYLQSQPKITTVETTGGVDVSALVAVASKEIRIGRVVKSHGVRGEVVVEPLADDEDSDEYYDHELTGLRVLHDGAHIGNITGGAGGIGKATAELLRSRGATVITADIKDADINCDLTTP